MIYDCFLFYNELELLEIRLHELDSVVDKFVIAEATRTFQKQPKKLYYQENKARFAKFAHKIEHIVIDQYPNFFSKFRVPTVWDYDNYQKEGVLKGLQQCAPEDQILFSDVDEIPNPEKIKSAAAMEGIKIFQQRFYNYYVNCICTEFQNAENKKAQINANGLGWWRGSVMLPFKMLKTVKNARMQRDNGPQHQVIQEGGWHFSFLGGIERVIKKLDAYAHPEVKDTYNSVEKIEAAIRNGIGIDANEARFKFVPVDNSLPAYIVDNQEKFSHLIFREDENV